MENSYLITLDQYTQQHSTRCLKQVATVVAPTTALIQVALITCPPVSYPQCVLGINAERSYWNRVVMWSLSKATMRRSGKLSHDLYKLFKAVKHVVNTHYAEIAYGVMPWDVDAVVSDVAKIVFPIGMWQEFEIFVGLSPASMLSEHIMSKAFVSLYTWQEDDQDDGAKYYSFEAVLDSTDFAFELTRDALEEELGIYGRASKYGFLQGPIGTREHFRTYLMAGYFRAVVEGKGYVR